jgi:catechol 2,3-dioxygenase-like lactoylglutathione lyase family enzyme
VTAATERVISGFDHVVIGVNDLAKAVGAYETLLGVRAAHAAEQDGAATAMLALGNIGVELMAPAGDGETARRLRAAIAERGEGLMSLVFATRDIAGAHRRFERVGLAPEAIAARAGFSSFRVSTERSHGVRVFVLQREAPLATTTSDVSGLDHIVIRSGDMERAAALYGARLGLDMRLDRNVMGRRLMFFRCDDAVVEIVEEPALAGGGDRLWGLSWRVADAAAAQARLAAAGLNVSEVRDGMKPGTRVFTVRDRTCGVPTLMVEGGPKRD